MMAIQQQQSENLDLLSAVRMVAKEKGIEPDRLIKTVEEAILKAAQSVFGANREFRTRFDERTGQIILEQLMIVVDDPSDDDREIDIDDAKRVDPTAEIGEELAFEIFWHSSNAKEAAEQDKNFGDILRVKQSRSAFGRIAAQTAKQVLIQRVRDEERDIVYNEFISKKGELIKGVVRRFEKGNNIIVDLNKTEGILPFREQTPRETYRPGDRIVAYVKEIDREARGPQVILSRSDKRLVEKLFEAEVPEIYEGIVKVVEVAREAGARSKIAVQSRDSDVDPVGACVGMKGSRVQAVVQELRGEKIDIVPWDRDPARFVCAAIQPADVHKVIIDEADRRMELVVPDEKYSLAIGRKGQNVRLANQLTGWKLDIIPVSKFQVMEDEALRSLGRINGVSDAAAKNLYRAGFRALEEVADASDEELAQIQGLGGQEAVARVKTAVIETMETLRKERLEKAVDGARPLEEHDRMLLVAGFGDRTVHVLEEHGYKTLEAVVREEDERLATRTGLGLKRGRALKQAAQTFLEQEWKGIATKRAASTPAVTEGGTAG